MSAKVTAPRKKNRRRAPKGVFCLEGNWWGVLDRPSSVRPILELLKQSDQDRVPYIHRNFETRAELDHCLRLWLQKRYSSYPILYLACHGNAGLFTFGDARRTENTVDLQEFAETYAGRCKRKIIHFGGCGTVDVHGHQLNTFLRKTGALAVCGYRDDVDWLESTAFECLLFSAMQANALTRPGVRAMRSKIRKTAGPLVKKLGFRMACRGKA